MSVNELREKISQHEDSIRIQQQALCELRRSIVEEIKPFVKTELKKNVEDQVKSDFEHTKELGHDKLASMKQQLLDLLDSSDSIVEKMFSDDALWIHVNYNADGSSYAFESQERAKEMMDRGIRAVLGEVGRLLKNFGYIEFGSIYRFDNHSHRSFNLVSGNQAQAKLFYRGCVSKPTPLEQLIDEYVKKIGPLHEECVEVSNLKTALLKQEAVDLWNEV